MTLSGSSESRPGQSGSTDCSAPGCAVVTLPDWYDPCEEVIRDMLPALSFLCCLQREPQRASDALGWPRGNRAG